MDLLHRIRWGNVARAAALLAAVVLVVAWPRLRADPPPLPPRPAVEEAQAAGGEELGFDTPREREPRTETPRRARAETPRRLPKTRRREKTRRGKPRRPRPSGVVVSPPASAPVRPHAWSPPRAEFGFE
jgi:hypothetical protein